MPKSSIEDYNPKAIVFGAVYFDEKFAEKTIKDFRRDPEKILNFRMWSDEGDAIETPLPLRYVLTKRLNDITVWYLAASSHQGKPSDRQYSKRFSEIGSTCVGLFSALGWTEAEGVDGLPPALLLKLEPVYDMHSGALRQLDFALREILMLKISSEQIIKNLGGEKKKKANDDALDRLYLSFARVGKDYFDSKNTDEFVQACMNQLFKKQMTLEAVKKRLKRASDKLNKNSK